MSSLSFHRKSNGTTYVYRQESYWDKAKKQPRNRQVCIGKLGDDGEVIYNRRFSDPVAIKALEQGETVAESLLIGQSLVLYKASAKTGLEKVLRRCFDAARADALLSLAYAVATGAGKMYMASVWIEQNECPAHAAGLSSPEISRVLASVSQDEIEDFLREWSNYRSRGVAEQYCYDLTSVSSYNTKNPFVEWGHNRDREGLAQLNMALLTGTSSRIPTYYECHPGSMADTKTIAGFLERMKKYGTKRIRMLLDRGFYSAANIRAMLAGHIGFYIPVPSSVAWQGALIDDCRDAVEMPEHVISISEDGLKAVYGMTALDKMEGKRVWKHVYFDTARRVEHITSLFASLATWERELRSGDTKKGNEQHYERYFTVKTTPKRGLEVRRNQEAINSYKADRAGYWVILTNCEKDAASALAAYKERTLVESQFDDMKNDLELHRVRTHGQDTMRGRVFVQFLAFVLTAQIRVDLSCAWARRMEVPEADRLARHYSLAELMMRLGTYRQTRFSDRYGKVVSAPTRAQRSIFKAFDVELTG
jgi:transposase